MAAGKAVLSSCGDMTSFTFGPHTIRFRTSRHLRKYARVKEWDRGYIVVDAVYDALGEVEEYIDLVPVLEDLYFDADEFLSPIQEFELGWKLLRDLLRYEGDATAANGLPRGILKASYRVFGFLDEQTWLAMLRDRNDIMHAYDEEELKRLLRRILEDYLPAFQSLSEAVADRYGDELSPIP